MATPSTASKGGSAHESVEFVAPSVPTTVSTTVFVFVVVIVIVIVTALHVGHAAFALLGFVATPTTSASASACWTNAAKVVLVVALDARVSPIAVFVLASFQCRE